jgi:hypothetical protein
MAQNTRFNKDGFFIGNPCIGMITKIRTAPIRMSGVLAMERSLRVAIALSGMAFAAAACTSTGAETSTKQDLLEQAGFVRRNADTPDRVAALKALPPHQFITRMSNGSIKYMYADPIACDCIYVGGQHAYDQYRQLMAAKLHPAQIRAILSTTPLPGESVL